MKFRGNRDFGPISQILLFSSGAAMDPCSLKRQTRLAQPTWQLENNRERESSCMADEAPGNGIADGNMVDSSILSDGSDNCHLCIMTESTCAAPLRGVQ
jgi:hypothetical protein